MPSRARGEPRLSPGSLWPVVATQWERGLRTRAVEPISTRAETVREAGVDFIVHVLTGLHHKVEAERRQRDAGRDPFLPPYERDLFLADVSPTHVAILNKFPVLPHHVLVVTREDVAQTSPLDEADFTALLACMADIDGLGFYNGGRDGGASQPHKHLQVVGPLGPGPGRTPLDALLLAGLDAGAVHGLPFRHALARPDGVFEPDPEEGAVRAVALYRELLAAIGRDPSSPGACNLLLTREWMMAVPRRRGRLDDIPVNALGYAGGLLARDEAGLARIRAMGPLALLATVGEPAGGAG